MSFPNLFPLKGRVALVTGSTTGLGKAIAFALRDAGAKVALNYQNNVGRADEAFAEFKAGGGVGMLVCGDVTGETEAPRLVEMIASEHGPVDILVLNATSAQPLKPIEEYDWAFFQQMLDFFVDRPGGETESGGKPHALPEVLRAPWPRRSWNRLRKGGACWSIFCTFRAPSNRISFSPQGCDDL